ncbi:MAG: succinate dehydrogenase, cytochrome b556 subunit [Halodesulfurarchaeum sp.]
MAEPLDRGWIEDFGRVRRFSAGMWAWVLHKATGWVLVGYLFAHVAVLGTAIDAGGDPAAVAAGSDQFTRTLSTLEGLFVVRVLEIGLIAAATFHLANGIRLLFVDLGIGLDRQAETFYVSLLVTALAVLGSLPILITPEVIPW